MRLALLVSIPLALLASSEVLSCAHRAHMLLDMSEKCQRVPVRIPSLFEQSVLKAVGATQIEGSCKVYEGKTNWITSWNLYRCSLPSKKGGAIEALLQMTLVRETFLLLAEHVTLSQKMRLALPVSIPWPIDIKWGTFHAPTEQILCVTWYVGEMPTCSSENSQLVRTECLESRRRDTDRGKLQGVCGKD